jgi:hypothetical protein
VLRFLKIGDPRTPKTGAVTLDIRSADLRDLTRDIVAMVQVHDGITSDIAVTSLQQPKELPITNDVAPQDLPVIDGNKVYYRDTALGEIVLSHDFSTTGWLRASSELAFGPVTSTQAVAWIETVGGQLRLAARLLPLEANPTVLVDDNKTVAFQGPAKADPFWAVGGRRIVFATGGPSTFSLFVTELSAVTGAPIGSAVQVANDSSGVFAIDPDGDEMVYVTTSNTVQRVALPSLTKTAVTVAGSGTIIMIDVDDNMIVAQRGGDPDRESGNTGTGQAVCTVGAGAGTATGVVTTVGAVRAPKVAHRSDDGTFLFSAAQNGDDAIQCTLTCASTPTCVVDFASSGLGVNIHVEPSRDGRISFLSNEGGLDRIVQFDVRARRWSFLTSGDFDREGLSVADGRVVWSDSSLATAAIFELNER